MQWLENLEFELEWTIRRVIKEHGGPIAVDHPRVKRLFQNLAAVRRLQQEVPHERDHHRLSA